jgi:hypothetical protein
VEKAKDSNARDLIAIVGGGRVDTRRIKTEAVAPYDELKVFVCSPCMNASFGTAS